MGVKILFFSRGTLGQNSMFPEKGGQNSIFFPSALKKGGQNRGAYQPTSLKGAPRVYNLTFIACHRADSRLVPSQWETLLQSNAVSHWLGANLESALLSYRAGANFTNQFAIEIEVQWKFNHFHQN